MEGVIALMRPMPVSTKPGATLPRLSVRKYSPSISTGFGKRNVCLIRAQQVLFVYLGPKAIMIFMFAF